LVELEMLLLVGQVVSDLNVVHGGHSLLLYDVVGFVWE
jgi:hypothetical protein